MTERLFLALWPGAAQRLALARVQGVLPLRIGRPTHPEDIHLTLVFLGPADPEQRHCAEMAAGRVRGGPFELTLDRVGSFPRARVLWCGADTASPPLAALVLALRSELASCGFVLDDRPYRPHATLARKAPALEARTLDPPIRWPVASFVLACGQEGPPPRYRILRRWSLDGTCAIKSSAS
ncbi:MAG: RNA 2',3'-cyclic phosphodiesterase [Chromatiaceae bacterium]|nr:RNA 2',3'-cyclic phosphodiesterase [Chromatiaceae bacterium]